jgi:hypothetical protein
MVVVAFMVVVCIDGSSSSCIYGSDFIYGKEATSLSYFCIESSVPFREIVQNLFFYFFFDLIS